MNYGRNDYDRKVWCDISSFEMNTRQYLASVHFGLLMNTVIWDFCCCSYDSTWEIVSSLQEYYKCRKLIKHIQKK